jgi:hypothetical protein
VIHPAQRRDQRVVVEAIPAIHAARTGSDLDDIHLQWKLLNPTREINTRWLKAGSVRLKRRGAGANEARVFGLGARLNRKLKLRLARYFSNTSA